MSETTTTQATNPTEGAATSTTAESTTTQTTATEAQSAQQQATTTQTTEAKPAEGAESAGETKAPGAPEKYEFKPAEGQPEFDQKTIEQFSDVARELNLPQDAAQKVLDKMAPVLAARQTEAIEAIRTQWADDAKADKEIGGDKLDENLATAKKAIDQFGTPELRTLLDQSGLGNHPEVIRAFYRAGKAISEDRFVSGQGSQTGQQSMAQRMYPNMNP